jgi:hypothetical protein
MNVALERLATEVDLGHPSREGLRLAFGYACAARVEHLLEDPLVTSCLNRLREHVAGTAPGDLAALAAEAAQLANHHQGSKSIDGCGHAAVSATYAVANATAGKALEAASYAAYAIVYAQGGYAAVAERESFAPEFAWQCERLSSLAAMPA